MVLSHEPERFTLNHKNTSFSLVRRDYTLKVLACQGYKNFAFCVQMTWTIIPAGLTD
jgi:hypothetical protein